MQLEKTMYVRTKDGTIERIIELGYQDKEYVSFSKDNEHLIYKNKIKASHNIIDLIEVGDIITYEFPTALGMLKYENVTVLESLLDILKSSDEYKILSIVTKEQFEQMQYKVG